MLRLCGEELCAGFLAGVRLEHWGSVAGDDDCAFAVAANLSCGVDERLGEEYGGTCGGDYLVDETAVFVGAGDDVIEREGYLVAACYDDRAAVVGTKFGKVGEGFDEVAMEESVAGVCAVVWASSEVEGVGRFGIGRAVGIPRVDDCLGFGEADDSTDDFFRHCDEARIGHVVEDGRVGFEDVCEVDSVRHVPGDAASADSNTGRIAGRYEFALEALERVEGAGSFVIGESTFDDDVSINVEVVALCGSERWEGAIEVGRALCGCHDGILPYPAMPSERAEGGGLCRNDARGWLRPDVEGAGESGRVGRG